jgi:hypothetical protein
MKRVTYVRTSAAAVVLTSFGVTLIYGGKPYPQDNGWSMGADAFEKLRAENPDVEFVEQPAKGATKKCPTCGATLTFRQQIHVPGTGAGFVDPHTSRGPVPNRETQPGWSCSDCDHVEWL